MEEEKCPYCERTKNTPRSQEEISRLKMRINRISGQLNGIGKMIEENRYCGDVLIQISACERALQEIGYIVLQNHLETCVREEVHKGNESVMNETMTLIRNLK